MNVKERDLDEADRGTVTLVPENLDDLWHLKYIIEQGDFVEGLTQRRVEGPDDVQRSTGGERETLEVRLQVEEVEFHRFSNRLRVSGVIKKCDRETEVGSHHTLNVEENDEITVEKRWSSDQIERLEEAEETEETTVAVATVEEGEAHVHTVEEYGVEERGTFRASTGKGEDALPRDELFDELTHALENLDADAVVLAGPGFTKRDALDYIEENAPDLAESVVTEDTASVGGRGVYEVL
ncbi:MAG: mRNA surveillance protein pelota, partial [Halobacteria archaeon]|nr:mRNA surveillance protein pelota [Halobacteria archaeon]